MRKNGGGHFFAIGSRAAVDLPNGLGAYAVSKAALLALIKVLAKEAEEYNISVNAIIPGTIDTPANRKAMPEADFSRWITPEEIAGTLIQLSRNSSVTGSFIELTGR
jgi:NAD(P)-dependent dehydrogenase (short-subunit alcohol dehydrogenase family)